MMGTYIKIFAEKKVDGDRYELHDFEIERLAWDSYGYFAWLGCYYRNYSSIEPLVKNLKGLPKDVSLYVQARYEDSYDAGVPSWINLDELIAVNYDSIIEDRRITVKIGTNSYSYRSTCAKGHGEKMTLRDFLDSRRVEEIFAMKEAGVDRLVYWFD